MPNALAIADPQGGAGATPPAITLGAGLAARGRALRPNSMGIRSPGSGPQGLRFEREVSEALKH